MLPSPATWSTKPALTPKVTKRLSLCLKMWGKPPNLIVLQHFPNEFCSFKGISRLQRDAFSETTSIAISTSSTGDQLNVPIPMGKVISTGTADEGNPAAISAYDSYLLFFGVSRNTGSAK